MRAALVTILAVAALALAGQASAASPAPGTLGAEVSANVIMDERPYVIVHNLGSVTTAFHAEAPDGWTVGPPSIILGPDQSGKFYVTGSGDGGDLVVTGSELAATTGDHAAIRFGSIALMQTRPFDPTRYVAPVLLGLLALSGMTLAARRLRPWRWRIVTS